MKFSRIILSALLTLTIAVSGMCQISATTSKTASKLKTAPKLVSLKNSSGGITISWKKVSGATGYFVYRKTAKTAYKKIATVKSGSTLTYTHKAAKSNTTYYYKVKAYNSKSASPASNVKSLLRVGTPTITVKNTASAVKAAWTKVTGATKYVLKYKKASAKKYMVAYKGTKLSFTNDNIASGGKYNFKVTAYIKTKAGASSSVATQIFLEQPSLNAEELLDMDGITLDWQKVKSAKGYYIYRSLKSQDSYKKIATIKSGSTLTYKDRDVTGINSYKYYIIAYNGTYKSVKSNVDYDVYGYYSGDETPLYLTISKGEVYKDINVKIAQYGADKLISWKSTDTSIVKVSDVGVITGVAKGTANLIATGEYNGKKHTITIITTVK